MEDLGNFGFSLGEIWDLELVLQDMEMEGATKSDESRSHSKTIPVISPSNSSSQPEKKEGENCLLDSRTNVSEEVSTTRKTTTNQISQDVVTEASTSGLETIDDSDEELNAESISKLLEYTTTDVISEMSNLEKTQLLNRVEHYEQLTANGFELQRPSFVNTFTTDRQPFPQDSRKEKPNKKSGKSTRTFSSEKPVPASDRAFRKRRAPVNVREADEDEDIIMGGVDAGPSSSTKKKISLKKSFRQKNLLKQAIDSASKRDAIIPEHLAFINTSSLTKVQKEIIKDYLENPSHLKFKIMQIIEGYEDTGNLVQVLSSHGYCSGDYFKLLMDLLVDHLYSLHSDPNALLTTEREAMAVCLVATFPKFAQRCTKEADKPWSWIFGKANGVGKLANNVANRQRFQDTPRSRNGGKRKAPQKAKQPEVIVQRAMDQSELSNEIKYLACISPIDSNKENITTLAKETFKVRRGIIMEGKYLLDSVLKIFCYLKAFHGEMILLEFDLMYPGKGNNMIKDGHQYIEKLLKLGYAEPQKYGIYSMATNEDCLNALIILAKFLPVPKRVYPYEKKMSAVASLDQIYQFIPLGSNIDQEIAKRRDEWMHPIQPYIMALGDKTRSVRQYLVLGDGHSIEMPVQPVLKTIDVLLKAYYVFNVPYHLAWKNAFRFLSVQIVGLPLENPRQSDFTAQHIELFNRF